MTKVFTSAVYILLIDVPESNTKWTHHLAQIEDAVASYKSCDPEKCSCHYPLIKKDLAAFKNGIGKDVIQAAKDRYEHTCLRMHTQTHKHVHTPVSVCRWVCVCLH